MGYDQDRYARLLASASFDCSFYKGTWQDLSKNRLAMSAVGSPSWTMVNGLPALASRVGNRIQSAVIAGIVDITQPFFVELLMSPSGTEYLLYQLNAGGMTVYYDTTVSYVQLYTYTAALGVARYITSPVGSWLARSFKHVIRSGCLANGG
jgi:hypothetical protein